MSAMDAGILKYATQAGLFILTSSMVIALYRVVRGPRHADRIIALDLLSILVVALAALYAVYSGHEAFLDVAIAYALVAFLGTVAFARYLERSATTGGGDEKSDTQGGRHG